MSGPPQGHPSSPRRGTPGKGACSRRGSPGQWKKECSNPPKQSCHLCKLKRHWMKDCSLLWREQATIPSLQMAVTDWQACASQQPPRRKRLFSSQGKNCRWLLTWQVSLLISWLMWKSLTLSYSLTLDLFPLKPAWLWRQIKPPDLGSVYSACFLPLAYTWEEM